MVRYNKIRKMDISNGPGVRVSIFLQGCAFHCKGCFNAETWDFKGGEELTDDVINHLMDLCSKDWVVGLSILGGEPLHPNNIEGTTKIAKKFKELYPEKTLWVWTGFLFDDVKENEVFKYIDVLVDGRFDIKLSNPKLLWKGSSNQRVIDVQKSLKDKKVVLHEDEKY